MVLFVFLFFCSADHRELHVLTHSFPTRRSSDLMHKHLGPAEIFILKGAGVHPQTGAYAQGDYVSERDQAVHDELMFQEDQELLMISSGPSAFLTPNDDGMFMMHLRSAERLRGKEGGRACVSRGVPER